MSIRDALLSGSVAGRWRQQPPGCGVQAGRPQEPRTPPSYAAPSLLLPWTSLQALAQNSSLTWELPGRVKVLWCWKLPADRSGTPGIATAMSIRVHPAEPHNSAGPPHASIQRQTLTDLLFRVVMCGVALYIKPEQHREKLFSGKHEREEVPSGSKGILLLSYSK